MTHAERSPGSNTNRETGPSVTNESTAQAQPGNGGNVEEDETRAISDEKASTRAAASEPLDARLRSMTFRGDDPSILDVAIFDPLRCWHLAVKLVQAACQRHPEHQEQLRHAFSVLPWFLPMRVMDEVYTAHVNEQLERIVAGQPVSEATRAEVFAALSLWSDSLDESAAALYAQLARELLRIEVTFESDQRPSEASQSTCEQMLASFRRRLGVTDRVFRIKKT